MSRAPGQGNQETNSYSHWESPTPTKYSFFHGTPVVAGCLCVVIKKNCSKEGEKSHVTHPAISELGHMVTMASVYLHFSMLEVACSCRESPEKTPLAHEKHILWPKIVKKKTTKKHTHTMKLCRPGGEFTGGEHPWGGTSISYK